MSTMKKVRKISLYAADAVDKEDLKSSIIHITPQGPLLDPEAYGETSEEQRLFLEQMKDEMESFFSELTGREMKVLDVKGTFTFGGVTYND